MQRTQVFRWPILRASCRRPNSTSTSTPSPAVQYRPIRRILAANRGEIAVRIFRAAREMGMESVAIFPKEDAGSLHVQSADHAFCIGTGKQPIQAYLDIDNIVGLARSEGVDAIHPGYGFLSENASFAQKVIDAGIEWIGPKPKVIEQLGDKTAARNLAIQSGLPVVPGTAQPISNVEEARHFGAQHGYPIMLKAAFGGGGRGMRIVRREEELEAAFESAFREAQNAFGRGDLFVEKFLESPRHVEVQILADKHGNVIHLLDRDCTIQRRHQKVVEIAPATRIPDVIRQQIFMDSLRLARDVGYENAGTIEFLVDLTDPHVQKQRYFFMEVNPRLQVEHTISEQVTGIDIVQKQILIAQGRRFDEMGIYSQEDIIRNARGCSIQLRVTAPSGAGTIRHLKLPEGPGIRVDGGAYGYQGAELTPHFDSLLFKIIASGEDLERATSRCLRSLDETTVEGAHTNLAVLRNILVDENFANGTMDTNYLDRNHKRLEGSKMAGSGPGSQATKADVAKLLDYLAYVSANRQYPGHYEKPISQPVVPPQLNPAKQPSHPGWRTVLQKEGPKGFAKAVRRNNGLLLTDTTMRDAHQSLLATRVRTHDLLRIASYHGRVFAPAAYSLETWGGATFDTAIQFLKECPWDRLEKLREAIPNVPFQMLLRGANAVGYTAYSDNVVFEFCKQAVQSGMDIFRVFDSLNYLPNIQLGIAAAGQAGAVVEAAISYTGIRGKYSLEYYVQKATECVKSGAHVICIKDMAGLLRPHEVRQLIHALRRELPEDVPIHFHMHDSAGCGVASMLTAAEYGADVIDVALDSMAGLTSQPAVGPIIESIRQQQPERSTGIMWQQLNDLDMYWEQCRALYSPFEATSTLKSTSSDIYRTEIPGGQYTNMHFQANALGLAEKWKAIKDAYAEANQLLGDIIKVTPSSKVVGDLAQFMVTNNLAPKDIRERADQLSFPSSVVDFFNGGIGIPHGGFDEALQQKVLKGKKPQFDGRPGAQLPPYDFNSKEDTDLHGEPLSLKDRISKALYPREFQQLQEFREVYGTLAPTLPTDVFFGGLRIGQKVAIDLGQATGKLHVELQAIGPEDVKSATKKVFLMVNGQMRSITTKVEKKNGHGKDSNTNGSGRSKADKKNAGHIGASMPGAVQKVLVKEGQAVRKGDSVIVVTAMKMDTSVSANRDGKVKAVLVKGGDQVDAGDLLVELEEEASSSK